MKQPGPPARLDGLPEDAVRVGTVGRPHGVRGEMRVVPESGDPTRLLDLGEVWIQREGEAALRREVVSTRAHQGAALFVLAGVGDRDVAVALTHSGVWARQRDLPAWGPDTFDVDAVIGLVLVDGERTVGRVAHVVTVGDRDYFEVEIVGGGRTALVPAVKDWLVELDVSGGRLVMKLPAGLLD